MLLAHGAKRLSTPSRTRTCNLPLRRRLLYPVELWRRAITDIGRDKTFGRFWPTLFRTSLAGSRASSQVPFKDVAGLKPLLARLLVLLIGLGYQSIRLSIIQVSKHPAQCAKFTHSKNSLPTLPILNLWKIPSFKVSIFRASVMKCRRPRLVIRSFWAA